LTQLIIKNLVSICCSFKA